MFAALTVLIIAGFGFRVSGLSAEGLSEDDKEMLEAVFAAAVNDAVRKIEANSQDKMSGMTAGMQLPPGMKLPF